MSTTLSGEILKLLAPAAAGFYPEQEAAILRLLGGQNTLCLMPTGRGKSLIFQYCACHLNKTAVVLSPLRALMSQQDQELAGKGLASAAPHTIADYRQYYNALRSYVQQGLPKFLYISPERAVGDGMLEYVLSQRREDVGLIVVDEAHCISQWGETFRPMYRMIPRFLNGVFGQGKWPPVLCLTATLKPQDQQEIHSHFGILQDGVIRSTELRRTNLTLRFEPALADQAAKETRLEAILCAHKGEKVIVYAHLVGNAEAGTRALATKFAGRGFCCDYFDGQAAEDHKQQVLDDFRSGKTPIVFATSAFGMGIHIPDIRVAVHYLIPESVEQYYQEVGRAGRDGLPSFAYLLFTDTNLKIRRYLLNRSVPSEGELDRIVSAVFSDNSSTFDPYSDTSENSPESTVFTALLERGVLELVGKGPDTLRSFACNVPDESWNKYSKATRTGAIDLIARRLKTTPQTIATDLFGGFVAGTYKLAASPRKVLFYRHAATFESKRAEIVEQFERVRAKRSEKLNEFVGVMAEASPEAGIFELLGI
jgi:ATP-dependent DNA helicase RecQ